MNWHEDNKIQILRDLIAAKRRELDTLYYAEEAIKQRKSATQPGPLPAGTEVSIKGVIGRSNSVGGIYEVVFNDVNSERQAVWVGASRVTVLP